MDEEVKSKWLAALRSGEYKQGRGGLYADVEGGRYCCLGVLCDVQGLTAQESIGKSPFLRYQFGGRLTSASMPPFEWLEDIGLKYEVAQELAKMNDGDEDQYGRWVVEPHTFEQIADHIERHA